MRCGAYLAHGSKHRQAEVQGAGLLGVDTPDHVCAVLDGLLAVEGARLARKALADHLSVLEDSGRRHLGLRARVQRRVLSTGREVDACVCVCVMCAAHRHLPRELPQRQPTVPLGCQHFVVADVRASFWLLITAGGGSRNSNDSVRS